MTKGLTMKAMPMKKPNSSLKYLAYLRMIECHYIGRETSREHGTLAKLRRLRVN